MKIKNLASTFAAYSVVICAIALTANTGYRVYEQHHRPPTRPWKTGSQWRGLSATGNRVGSQHSITTIVVFSDYECPACLALERQLRDIRERYGSSVSIVYRDFPLPFHEHARSAAIASQCAAEQGRFAAYHDRLFDDFGTLGQKSLIATAATVHVSDTTMFDRCLHDPRTEAAVDVDVNTGKRLGVYATPTVIIGADAYLGVPVDLMQIVERQIQSDQPNRKA